MFSRILQKHVINLFNKGLYNYPISCRFAMNTILSWLLKNVLTMRQPLYHHSCTYSYEWLSGSWT